MGSYSGYDLWGILRFFGQILLIAAIIVGVILLIAWWQRRRGKGTQTLAVDVTLTICGWLVIMFLIATPISIVQTMTAIDVNVQDFPFQTSLLENRFPCGTDAPPAGGAHIECLGIDSGWATLTGLSTGVRMLLATDQLLWAMLSVLPAVALGIICFQLLRGVPFTRTVTRTLVISAAVVLILGVAACLLDGISKGAASAAVLPLDGSSAAFSSGAYSVTIPMWPFGAALALMALAAVFRYGAKLQRDTEGLV